jgi:hypothetical protein
VTRLGETAGTVRPVSDPNDTGQAKFGSSYVGVNHFQFLDGYVSPISDTIATTELMALSAIAGGETVTQQN